MIPVLASPTVPKQPPAILLFSALFLLCASVLTYSQEIVVFDDSNPPYMYLLENRAAGLYPALIREAFSRFNLTVDCQVMPWKRALIRVRDNPVGIGGLYKNREREQYLDFSEPFFTEALAIYYLKKNGAAYTHVSDLKGKRVGVIDGWSYGDVFDDAVRKGAFLVEPNASDALNFKKLASDRIDAVVAIIQSGDPIVSSIMPANLIARSEPIYALDVFMAFNRAAHKGALLKRFDRAIREMQADGSFDKIVERELGTSR